MVTEYIIAGNKLMQPDIHYFSSILEIEGMIDMGL